MDGTEDITTDLPIYRQIMNRVKRMVASGQLQPGSRLPSVRELATQYSVNPMTISKAYTLLQKEGLLVRQQGKPMQVASVSRKDLQTWKENLITPAIENLLLVAKELNWDIDELLVLIKRHGKNE